MKNKVTLKENKWVWPIIDENSWEGQNNLTELSNKILPFLKSKKLMVQAGGNCGFLLSTFIEHFDTIYTFEPDPVNFYCLNQNVTSSKVIKLQSCLGNVPYPVKTQQLIREGRKHDIGGVHVNGDGVTPTLTIDSLNLPYCDLIQLDVEGYELNALKGAVKTINKFNPVLCVEFCEKWLNRYDTSSQHVFDFMSKINYIEVESYGVDKIFIKNEL